MVMQFYPYGWILNDDLASGPLTIKWRCDLTACRNDRITPEIDAVIDYRSYKLAERYWRRHYLKGYNYIRNTPTARGANHWRAEAGPR